MRVRLKGLNKVSTKLADGKVATYYYAWKGGPRLEGKPGSPEFIASYNQALAKRKRSSDGTVQFLLDAYQNSPEYQALAPRTRADYRRKIWQIESEFGDFPLKAYEDRRTRGEFMAWRDRLGVKSRRQADYTYAVLALINAWAFNRGLISLNPCERAGRLYRAARKSNVWSEADEQAFYSHAPEHMHLALTLALWTGQRQGDLLILPWSACQDGVIKLRQGKTNTGVVIPVGAPLQAAFEKEQRRLAALPADIPRPATMLSTLNGKTWTQAGFRASWRKACIKAGVSGVTYHDLRGTAVTRLALAGCTAPEIATITGHSLRDVGSILDSHYLNRDPRLAETAIRKLELAQKLPNGLPNGP